MATITNPGNPFAAEDLAKMTADRKAAADAARAAVEAARTAQAAAPAAAPAAQTAAQGAGAMEPGMRIPEAGQAKPGIVDRTLSKVGLQRTGAPTPASTQAAPQGGMMKNAFTKPVTMGEVAGGARNLASRAYGFMHTPGVMNAAAGGIPMLAAAVGTAADDTDDRYSQRFGGVFDYNGESSDFTNALRYGAQRTLGWAGDVAKMVTPDAALKYIAPNLYAENNPAGGVVPVQPAASAASAALEAAKAMPAGQTPIPAAPAAPSIAAAQQKMFSTNPADIPKAGGTFIGKFGPARTQAEREARDTAFMNAMMANNARAEGGQGGGRMATGNDIYSTLWNKANSLIPDHKADPNLRLGNYDLNHVAQALVNKRRGDLFDKMLHSETEMGKSRSSLEMKRMELGMKGSEDVQKMLQGMATMNGVDKDGKPTTTIDHAKIEDFVNELHARDGQMRKQFGYGAADVMKSPDMARQAFADYERNVLKTRKAMGGVTENSLLRADPENIGDITQTVVRPSKMSDSWTNGVMTGGDGRNLPTHNAIGFWRSLYDKANPFGRPEDNLTVEATTSEGHRKLMKYRDLVDQDAVLANQIRAMQKREAK